MVDNDAAIVTDGSAIDTERLMMVTVELTARYSYVSVD